MRSAIPTRRSPLVVITFVFVALLLGMALTIGTLWAMGVDLPFFSRKEPAAVAAAQKKEGVPVPLVLRTIPAGTRITKDYFLDPKTEDFKVRYLPQKEVERLGIIVEVTKLFGRVTLRDKPAGSAFTEKDLHPPGMRPGMTSFLPPGKRSFVLLADKVEGMHGLFAGDRFDIVGSLPVDLAKALAQFRTGGNTDAAAIQGMMASPKKASVQVLVQDGAVARPVTMREVPTGTTPGKNGKLPTKPVQEITIAVDPKEVAILTEALAVGAHLTCVARSGHPDEANYPSTTPGSPPGPKVHIMETIVGNQRKTLVFTGSGQGPQEQPAPEPKGPEPKGPEERMIAEPKQ